MVEISRIAEPGALVYIISQTIHIKKLVSEMFVASLVYAPLSAHDNEFNSEMLGTLHQSAFLIASTDSFEALHLPNNWVDLGKCIFDLNIWHHKGQEGA